MKAVEEGCGCFPTGRHYPGIAGMRIQAGPRPEIAMEYGADDAWVALPMFVLDVETTGLEPEHDRVIEVGVALVDGGRVGETRAWLVQPGMPVPEASRTVHGITDEELEQAPAFEQIADEVLELVGNRIPVAYNARFDRDFLHAEMRRAGRMDAPDESLPPALRERVVWIDPLVWVRHLRDRRHLPEGELGNKLGEVAASMGIPLERAHRAAGDAECAARVLLALAPKMSRSYADLVRIQQFQGAHQDAQAAQWRRR